MMWWQPISSATFKASRKVLKPRLCQILLHSRGLSCSGSGGARVGLEDGAGVGETDGDGVGETDGSGVGETDGGGVGDAEGLGVGAGEGGGKGHVASKGTACVGA